MNIQEFMALTAFGLSLAAFLWLEMAKLRNELKTEIKNEMKQFTEALAIQSARIDKQDARIDKQSARSDKLYEMFIDLLRERKSTTPP